MGVWVWVVFFFFEFFCLFKCNFGFQKIKAVFICGHVSSSGWGRKKGVLCNACRKVLSDLWIQSFSTFSLSVFEFL